MLIVLMFHGSSKWTGSPEAFLWILPPIFIYLMGKRSRLSKVFGTKTAVQNVQVKPGMLVLYLDKPSNFQKLLQPGHYVNLNIPFLSSYEWHPFTVTSSPEDDYLSLHILRNGDWTNSLHDHFSSQEHNCTANTNGVLCPPSWAGEDSLSNAMYIGGPFGISSQKWNHYKTVVFVGVRTGVIPFISILKAMLNTWESHRCECCGEIKHPKSFPVTRVYFYWLTGEMEKYEWFDDVLNQLMRLDFADHLEF